MVLISGAKLSGIIVLGLFCFCPGLALAEAAIGKIDSNAPLQEQLAAFAAMGTLFGASVECRADSAATRELDRIRGWLIRTHNEKDIDILYEAFHGALRQEIEKGASGLSDSLGKCQSGGGGLTECVIRGMRDKEEFINTKCGEIKLAYDRIIWE
jgi:hypothetical protein